MISAGHKVGHAHLRYINPFPANLKEVLSRYKKVLIPEWNLGQLAMLIRSKFLVDAVSYSKVQGQPFTIAEIKEQIQSLLEDN